MVRVLECHHFTAQHVFQSAQEPIATCTTDTDLLFVATANSLVEVYDLATPGCPQIHQFPTVGVVMQIQYSQTDDFVVTLEEKHVKYDVHYSVRVYLNWRKELTDQPMRVRIAGDQSLTKRQSVDGSTDSDQFEAVEIPLKNEYPSCIAVDGRTGNLVAGVKSSILMYGLCVKKLAGSDATYKDIKCVLELSYSFRIHEVAICEEFIMCCCKNKVQVIKLNLESVPGLADLAAVKNIEESFGSSDQHKISDWTDSDDNVLMTEKTTRKIVDENIQEMHNNEIVQRNASFKVNEERSRSSSFTESSSSVTSFAASKTYIPSSTLQSAKASLSNKSLKSHDSRLSNQEKASSKSGQSKSSTQVANVIVEDEHHVNFYMGEKASEMKAKAEDNQIRVVWLKSVKDAHEQTSRRSRSFLDADVLLTGPFQHHDTCPVTVEYESVCCGDQGLNLVERGVVTCLYKEVGSEDANLSSVQLMPTYVSAAAAGGRPGTRCSTFVSAARGALLGMAAFFSSRREGSVYSVGPGDDVARLTEYPYTSQLVQACLGEQLLYVATRAGLEIYTSRVAAAVMHDTQAYDHITKTLPACTLEPCLIGLKPFISPDSLGVSRTCTVLLSKVYEQEDSSAPLGWSIYALRRPTFIDLYNDMQEICSIYRSTSLAVYQHMLQESHLLARSATFLGSSSNNCSSKGIEQATQTITFEKAEESALCLALYYARAGSEQPELTIPYLYLTNKPVGELLTTVCTKLQDDLGEGLWLFLHHMLYEVEPGAGAPCSRLSSIEGDQILAMYEQYRSPQELADVILNSHLQKYSNEKALCLLKSCMARSGQETDDGRVASMSLLVLAAVIVHLRVGELAEAEDLIFSIGERALVDVCVQNAHVLHVNYTCFSHLTQLIRRHKPSVFLDILVRLHDNGTIVMETTMHIFEREDSGQDHLRMYLEMLVSEKSRHYLFNDAVKVLVGLYLDVLEGVEGGGGAAAVTNTTINQLNNKVAKGVGHFARRYSWLDHLPPLKGTKALNKPCQRVRKTAVQKHWGPSSQLIASTNLDQNKLVCPCLICNATLLKLQSLLCSTFITDEVCKLVLSRIGRKVHSSQKTDQTLDKTCESLHQSILDLAHDLDKGLHDQNGSQEKSSDKNIVSHDEATSCTSQSELSECGSESNDNTDSEIGHNKQKLHEDQLKHEKSKSSDTTAMSCDESSLGSEQTLFISIQLLCDVKLEPKVAVECVVERFPKILCEFTTETFGVDNNLWPSVCESLTLRLRQQNQPGGTYHDTYIEVLKLLSVHLTPSAFIELLPADGSTAFFVDYVEKSIQAHQAKQLKHAIMAGTTHSTMLNSTKEGQ